jgi:predicted secreted hydrolase
MPPIRFRSRFLHATIFDYTQAGLDALGWITPPINFGTEAITMIDFQPDERLQQIQHNTVAVSLGDYENDEDEELGAGLGGTRSAPYVVFVDVYMAEQALSHAICDDVRDIFTDQSMYLVDQITQIPTSDLIQIDNIDGPARVPGGTADQFRRHWRAMRLDCRLFFQS